MRLRPLLLIVACSIAACHDSPISPQLAALVGDWTNTSSVNTDGSVYRITLSLYADQTYVRDWRAYRSGGNGALGDVFAYVTTEGNYTVRGDSIFMRPVTDRSWDRDFNGGVVQVVPVSSSGVYGERGARFEIFGSTLVFHFLTYPAEAPVETTELLLRVR